MKVCQYDHTKFNMTLVYLKTLFIQPSVENPHHKLAYNLT